MKMDAARVLNDDTESAVIYYCFQIVRLLKEESVKVGLPQCGLFILVGEIKIRRDCIGTRANQRERERVRGRCQLQGRAKKKSSVC